MYMFPIVLNVIFLRILSIFGYYQDKDKLIRFKTVVSKGSGTDDFSIDVRENWIPIPKIDVSEDLDTFYSELNEFSGESGFLYKAFEIKYNILKVVLLHLQKGLLTHYDNPILMSQLLFTKRTFHSLVSSMHIMLRIDKNDSPIHGLIRKVIGYKALVLTFFNSHGSLNIKIDHLSDKISSISEDLTFLESQFRLSETVRIDLTMIFDFEIAELRYFLEELKSQLPKQKKVFERVEGNMLGVSSQGK